MARFWAAFFIITVLYMVGFGFVLGNSAKRSVGSLVIGLVAIVYAALRWQMIDSIFVLVAPVIKKIIQPGAGSIVDNRAQHIPHALQTWLGAILSVVDLFGVIATYWIAKDLLITFADTMHAQLAIWVFSVILIPCFLDLVALCFMYRKLRLL